MRKIKTFLSAAVAITALAVFAVPVFAQDGDGAPVDDDSVTLDIDSINRLAGQDDAAAIAAAGGAGAYPYRQPENYALVLLRITGYLVIVTAVIFGAAWGIRKLGIAGVSKVGGGRNMDVIESIYIGQNRGTSLIRVADTVYLIGHTPENIVLLEKIEGGKAIDLIASAKGGAAITSFKDALNNFMGKMKKS